MNDELSAIDQVKLDIALLDAEQKMDSPLIDKLTQQRDEIQEQLNDLRERMNDRMKKRLKLQNHLNDLLSAELA